MTPKEAENFYDTAIAPTLLHLCKHCEDNGIPFLAHVEFSPGKFGKTMAFPATAEVSTRMIYMAMMANGNVDALIMSLLKYGKEHGHNSIYLHLLETRRPKT